MSDFEQSHWADSEFSQHYRDDADAFLPLRQLFFETAQSLYGHFIADRPDARVVDLGCGDGLFIQKLHKSFAPAAATMVDGSADMLAAAKKRLAGCDNIEYIQASFQELLAAKPLAGKRDFIFSSLAVHHLPFAGKKALYSYIYELLRPGGWFVHYDVVLSPSETIEAWYMDFWRKWISALPDRAAAEKFMNIPDDYKQSQCNTPDDLASQLAALEELGFQDVDCYLKFGIFTLFGGRKQ